MSSIKDVSTINGLPYFPTFSVPSNLVVSTMTVSSLTTTTSLNVSSVVQSPLYIGNNKGLQWSQTGSAGGQNWSAVSGGVISGVYYACVNGGFIYYSSNGGVSWTQQATVKAWTGIATGAVSGYAVACVAGGGIYYTTNSGTTWTLSASAPTANWSAICSDVRTSSNYVFACVNGGGVYQSTNGGSTWALISGSVTANWTAMTAFNYNMYVVNTNLTNGCYRYFGSSLQAVTTSPSGNFNSVLVTSEADTSFNVFLGRTDGFIYASDQQLSVAGTFTFSLTSVKGFVSGTYQGFTVIAVQPGSPIYASYDYGKNWFPSNSPSLNWSCVTNAIAPSPTGVANSINPLMAGTNTGYIWADVPYTNLPNTEIIGHNLTLRSDTGQINLLGANVNISTNNTTTIYSPQGITFSAGLTATNSIVFNTLVNFSPSAQLLAGKVFSLTAPSGTSVRQPLIQYGTAAAGATSPYTVTLPQAYTNTSYVVQLTHNDTTANTIVAASVLTTTTFSIAWTGAVGSQSVYWTTFGT